MNKAQFKHNGKIFANFVITLQKVLMGCKDYISKLHSCELNSLVFPRKLRVRSASNFTLVNVDFDFTLTL
jgi:hypothetical protein